MTGRAAGHHRPPAAGSGKLVRWNYRRGFHRRYSRRDVQSVLCGEV